MFLLILITICFLISSIFFNLANIINKNKYIIPSAGPSPDSPSGPSPVPSGPSPPGPSPGPSSPVPLGPSPPGPSPPGPSPPVPSPITSDKYKCDKKYGCIIDNDNGNYSTKSKCLEQCGIVCDIKEGCINKDFNKLVPGENFIGKNDCSNNCKFYGCSDGSSFGPNYFGECKEIDPNSTSDGEYSTINNCDEKNCLIDKHDCCPGGTFNTDNSATVGTICNSSLNGANNRTQGTTPDYKNVVYKLPGDNKLWNLNMPCNNKDSIPCFNNSTYTWLQQKKLNSYGCGSDKNPIHFYGNAISNNTNTYPCKTDNCGNIDNIDKKFYRATQTTNPPGTGAGSYIKCENPDKYYPVVVANYKENDIYSCVPKYLNKNIDKVVVTGKNLKKSACGITQGEKATKITSKGCCADNCTQVSLEAVKGEECADGKNIHCYNGLVGKPRTSKATNNQCTYDCDINWNDEK